MESGDESIAFFSFETHYILKYTGCISELQAHSVVF